MDKILLIDGNSLANRAFYALPFLTDTKGRPSGAVFGFANILVKVITEEKPKGIIVAFDHARKTFRNLLFEEYKATRKQTPPELIEQFPLIKQMLKEMGIKVIEKEGIEADDIIGTCVKNLSGQKIILSGDRDLLQLIDDDTQVWLTMKGVSIVNKIGKNELKAVFHLLPSQVVELKALMGDSSDNIPGVKGVGEKTALKLIEDYGNLDAIYKNIENIKGKLKERLVEDKSMAYLSKQLATIKTDCQLDENLEDCSYQFPFNQNVQKLFKEFAFGSLLKRDDLFGNQIIVEEKNRKMIDCQEVLDLFVASIDKTLAYNLEKMEFSIKAGEIYYLSPTFDMFMSFLSLQDVLTKLKPIFENAKILKITSDAKNDMHKLRSLGISLNNFFDVTLASYLIHAGEVGKNVSESCDEFFALKDSLQNRLQEDGLNELYFNLELPLSKVLFDMEENGFKIDEASLKVLSEEFSAKLNALTSQIIKEAGEDFNINSPKQVAHILFDKLGLVAFGNKKNSTGIDILNELKYAHPIVEKIIQYRKYQKLKSTYIDVYLRLCAEKGDVIHTSFHQSLTNTGRISSSDPNLQNIPTNDEEGKVLRKIFVSKFDNGMLISADYNQIELRLLADMSGEQKLIDIYNRGEDIHTMTACQIFHVSPQEVTQKMRREAKAVNFGIIYGISDYGLSQNIKVSRQSAKEYISSYFAQYPAVKQFSENNIIFAKQHGFIKTKYGRIRHIPELKSSNYNIRAFGERVAMNMPLQGTASDIIKMAMLKVYNALNEKGLKSQLILQIHDELVLDVYPGEEESIVSLLHEAMEGGLNLKVPLPISINLGKNLLECK